MAMPVWYERSADLGGGFQDGLVPCVVLGDHSGCVPMRIKAAPDFAIPFLSPLFPVFSPYGGTVRLPAVHHPPDSHSGRRSGITCLPVSPRWKRPGFWTRCAAASDSRR